MQQFPHERAVFSFTGLPPSEDSSGDRRRVGHISRQGAGRLRHVLVESAWVAIRKDPDLTAAFERIAHRAGKKRAIVAIARKLIGRARAVLRTQRPYEVGPPRAA
jgi:transposase